MYPYDRVWMPGLWPVPKPPPSPQLRATFDRNPEKLTFFLNQVWAHFEWHGEGYPDDIVANLEGEQWNG